MIIKTFITTLFQQNTRVLACEATNRAVCLDPGDSAEMIADFINTNNLDLQAIMLTHAHLDHIGGVSDLKKLFPQVEIFLHRADEDLYYALPQQPIVMGIQPRQLKELGFDYEIPPELTGFWQNNQIYEVGKLSFKILHTPGHTRGHVVFFEEAERKVFGGDCLFANSIGRTDLPGGDFETLMNSINNTILPLGDDVIVYTGHGAETTIGREKSFNPFLNGVYKVGN